MSKNPDMGKNKNRDNKQEQLVFGPHSYQLGWAIYIYIYIYIYVFCLFDYEL